MAWLGAAASSALAILALRPEMGGAAREPVVALIAAVGLAALAAVIGRAGGRGRAEPRNQTLAAAIEADERARLILDAEGRVALRNARADDLFGPAEDPAAPLIARVGADERAAEEIGRLVTAARQGGTYRTEVWLPRIGGGEWMVLTGPPPGRRGHAMDRRGCFGDRAPSRRPCARENELLADFIDFMPVGFYSADAGGRFRFVNQRLAEWLGRRVGELVGCDVAEVLGIAPDPEEESADLRLPAAAGIPSRRS